ncbi:MAG TPA: hypothetical protein VK936_08835 [Longimicrobiales bacterium]|nr:hypothetical protein [Longimicrobiales bacterium]
MSKGRARSGVVALAVGVVVLPAAACGDLLGTAPVEATAWALESLDGGSLPAVSVANEWVTLLTRADTLRFDGGTRGTQIVHWDAAYSSPEVADESGRTESAFRYRVRQGRVEISFDCPPNALCVAPPHLYAVPVDGALRVQQVGGGVVRIYRRVTP